MKTDYSNINTYLHKNPSDNHCKHQKNRIQRDDFEKIGSLYDPGIGTLAYLQFSSKNPAHLFTSAYPLADCQILECKKCRQIVFFHINNAGVAPRPEYFLADYTKTYLNAPAAKSIALPKAQITEFAQEYHLPQLLRPQHIRKQNTILIPLPPGTHIYNYYETKAGEQTSVRFDIVGKRPLLRKMNQWLPEQ